VDLQPVGGEALDGDEGPSMTTQACPASLASCTEITKAQRDILAQLKIDPPPRIYQLTPASP
jgi:hypothetical protein